VAPFWTYCRQNAFLYTRSTVLANFQQRKPAADYRWRDVASGLAILYGLYHRYGGCLIARDLNNQILARAYPYSPATTQRGKNAKTFKTTWCIRGSAAPLPFVAKEQATAPLQRLPRPLPLALLLAFTSCTRLVLPLHNNIITRHSRCC